METALTTLESRGGRGGVARIGDSTTQDSDKSASMALMGRVVKAVDKMADSELEKIIRFAVEVRDDTSNHARERMRAAELLNTMIAKGVDIAQYIDKNDRLDKGKPTANVVNVTYVLVFDE